MVNSVMGKIPEFAKLGWLHILRDLLGIPFIDDSVNEGSVISVVLLVA